MFYRTFRREAATILFKAFIFVVSVMFLFGFADSYYTYDVVSDGTCNVAVLPIEGVILPFNGYADYGLVTTPSFVRDFVSTAETDPSILAILFEINSPGGAPVAAEQIAEYIKSSELPTASLIGDIGTSGGYLVAASADTVIASAMSQVGSIGVTMSYLDNSAYNEIEGYTYVELASGKFKDAGSPDKPLTDEERELFMRDINIVHEEFVNAVATLRNKPIDEIKALADGSSMTGRQAETAGLVDKIGGRSAAKNVFAQALSLTESEIVFCEYATDSFLPY